MHQPAIIEYWREKAAAEARQQSVRENTREKILEALEHHLQPNAASVFKPILEQIDDLSGFNELFRAAIQVDRVLEANGN